VVPDLCKAKNSFSSHNFFVECKPPVWREERENQDTKIRCLLSTSVQHVSGIIMPIFRRIKTVSYCTWCTALVLLDVVGSGCGALGARILQRSAAEPLLTTSSKTSAVHDMQ